MCHDSAASAITFATREFVGYGPSHWVVLAIFGAGSAALVWIGRRQSEPQARVLSRILGALTAALYAALLIYKLHSSTIVDAVPLQLSDLAPFIAAYAWWSHRHWAFALTYYWGLVLSSQALITPVFNGPDFPNYKFLVFWALHLLVVWAAIYLTWGRRMRPSWRSYRFAVITTFVWAIIAFTFNTFAGTNYGFLNRKPEVATMLDILGPWPIYLVPEVALVLIVWALMTWPWERRPVAGIRTGTAR